MSNLSLISEINDKFDILNIYALNLTIKKIITIAWAVIILLYNWLSAIYCTPGPDNSRRISTENAVPINPENSANIKYNVPISLALDERNHLSFHKVISVNRFFTFLGWFLSVSFISVISFTLCAVLEDVRLVTARSALILIPCILFQNKRVNVELTDLFSTHNRGLLNKSV